LTDQLESLDADDDDLPAIGDSEIGGKVKISLADMDLPSWEHELKADMEIIDALLASMNKITPADDAKLQHLKSLILGKLAAPINPGNKKILLFTAFADTADYLYANLAPDLLAIQHFHSAKVTGGAAPKSTLKKSYDFQELLTLFSPRSKEKAVVLPNEPAEIDLLIGTDCISEGQNLQDCDYLINYDIHWNPVRIIQRFGRIDRIGSTNASIQLVNYWPDISLDEYINLKERVESRMMIADVTAIHCHFCEHRGRRCSGGRRAERRLGGAQHSGDRLPRGSGCGAGKQRARVRHPAHQRPGIRGGVLCRH
jgi:superfamily II DNA/RNA helicase